MARPLRLIGNRYDRLLVIGDGGSIKYGGRKQTLWNCQCDCGNLIDLPSAKLPYSEPNIMAAARAGRLLYTCCETCRMKKCPLCFSTFSHSHTSHVCPSPTCQAELQNIRDDFWHARNREKYRDDPAYREKMRNYFNGYYAKNIDRFHELRRLKISQLSDDELQTRIKKRAEDHAKYYSEIKNNPELYDQRMAGIRKRRAEREMERFLADAQTIFLKGLKL